MTHLALRGAAILHNILVPAHPSGPHRVQSMRATGHRIWRVRMTGGALGQHAHVPLVLEALKIVVRVSAGKFSVRRAVASFAFNSAMAGRESIQGQPGRGDICGRGKRRHGRQPESAVGNGVGKSDLALVMNRIPRVAGLTVGFFEPARSIGRRNTAHQPVATLALHRHRPIGGNCLPHCTAQTLGRGPRMALITGRAVGCGIQRQPRRRIRHIGMAPVNGRRQGLDPRQPTARQRLAEMAAGTENRRAASGRGRQARGIIPVGGQRCGIQWIPELQVIVSSEDVLAEIQNWIWIIHPPGCRASRRTAGRRMAGPAIHLIRDWQHNIGGRQHFPTTLGRQSHHWITVEITRIIIRCERDSVGRKPILRRFILHRLRTVSSPRHGKRIRPRDRQPHIQWQRQSKQGENMIPEIRFPDRTGVDGAGRIRNRLVGHRNVRRIGHELAAGVDQLRHDRVVRREQRENGEVVVHAMHAQVVPTHQRIISGCERCSARSDQQCSQHKKLHHPLFQTPLPRLAHRINSAG